MQNNGNNNSNNEHGFHYCEIHETDASMCPMFEFLGSTVGRIGDLSGQDPTRGPYFGDPSTSPPGI